MLPDREINREAPQSRSKEGRSHTTGPRKAEVSLTSRGAARMGGRGGSRTFLNGSRGSGAGIPNSSLPCNPLFLSFAPQSPPPQHMQPFKLHGNCQPLEALAPTRPR